MVFPVAMCGCESWTIKKAEHQRIDAFELWYWRRLSRVFSSSKASILQCSAFFMIQLSHSYMTTGKTIAFTRWAFDGKVMSLVFNMVSRLVTAFLPRNKCLSISWLQSPSAVILEPKKYSQPLFPLFPHLFAMK